MKPRIYNTLAENPVKKYRKNPIGIKLAISAIDDSITPWRNKLQEQIAMGNYENQLVAQTVIKVLEKTKEDLTNKYYNW